MKNSTSERVSERWVLKHSPLILPRIGEFDGGVFLAVISNYWRGSRKVQERREELLVRLAFETKRSTKHEFYFKLEITLTHRSTISWLAPHISNCPSSKHATGAVWLSNVRCRGNESSLDQCPNAGWGSGGIICSDHTSDVCLVCDNPLYQNSGEGYYL